MNAKTTAWLYYHTGIDMMHRFIIFLYNSKQTPSLLLVDHTHSNLPKRHNWPPKSSSSSSTVSFFLPVPNQRPKLAIKQLLGCHKQSMPKAPSSGQELDAGPFCMDFKTGPPDFIKNYEN
jgi:hypothetical protein